MTTGQGLLPYTIEVVDDDTTLTGHAGLPLVLETMRALGVSEVLDGALGIRRRNHGATDAQKAEALVLLMAAGGDSVDDIEVLRADKGLQRLSGSLPSADVLLTFLHAFHDERLIEQAQRDRSVSQVAYIPEESAPLVGLSRAFGPLSEPLRRVCERLPEQAWTLCDDRPTETVMCADVEFAPGDWPKDAEPLRYVALRIRKKQGHLFGGGYDT